MREQAIKQLSEDLAGVIEESNRKHRFSFAEVEQAIVAVQDGYIDMTIEAAGEAGDDVLGTIHVRRNLVKALAMLVSDAVKKSHDAEFKSD